MLEKKIANIKEEIYKNIDGIHLGIEELQEELDVDETCNIPETIEMKSENIRRMITATFLEILSEKGLPREIRKLDELQYFISSVVNGIIKKIEDFKDYEDLICEAFIEDEYIDVVFGKDIESILNEVGYSDLKKLQTALGNMSKSDLNAMTPYYAPNAERWIGDGGKIYVNLDDNGVVWKYVDKDGKYADYYGDRIVFPKEAIHPTIKPVTIESFLHDRDKDKAAYLEKQYKLYGIKDIPKGYVLHHGYINGEFMLIKDDYHKIFTHYGGYSLNKNDLY